MSSIVKKVLMAITGIGLSIFLVLHLAGNLFIFSGPNEFNGYAAILEHNPLLIPAEIVLLGIFLVHLIMAIKLTGENNAARPIDYQHRKTMGESTLASRTMIYSGVIILVFVILHVYAFKFGEKKVAGKLELWELVIKTFQNPLVVVWYVLAMILLGFHLSHGLASSLQSMGAIKPDWRHRSRRIGAVIGWIIALGFASMPLYAIFAKPTPPPVTTTTTQYSAFESGHAK